MEVTILQFLGICLQAIILSLPFLALISLDEIAAWIRRRRSR